MTSDLIITRKLYLLLKPNICSRKMKKRDFLKENPLLFESPIFTDLNKVTKKCQHDFTSIGFHISLVSTDQLQLFV